MSVSRHISARAREQVARQVQFFQEDYPLITSCPQNAACLWIGDFDGNVVQMYRLMADALAPLGWRLRTIKGVKTFERTLPPTTEAP